MTTTSSGGRRTLPGFYAAVVLIALAGQAIAAVEWLHWHPLPAVLAVAALEFGGIVLSVHALARMQLGERALAARALSAAVAAFAVAFNWFGHADKLQASFFAGMSALGYLVWLLDSAARRRDHLRAAGMLPPAPPAYGAVQWARHPWLTREARQLALRDPGLGLYGSLEAAAAARHTAKRRAAIAALLHKKLRAGRDPLAADIAVAVYDVDEIAARLAAGADYDGLTGLLAAELVPARVAQVPVEVPPAADPEPAAEVLRPATPETVPAAAPTSGAPSGRKRTPAEHFRLASALVAGDPTLTQTEVAETLGISTRRLRDILRIEGKKAAAQHDPAEVAAPAAPRPAGRRGNDWLADEMGALRAGEQPAAAQPATDKLAPVPAGA